MEGTVEPGEYVTHDGETWRVARTTSLHAEIYRGSNGPRTVPVSDVTPINGGER